MRLWKKCPHLATRCIHGDEINYKTKVYYLRFWKKSVARRQLCLDCGEALVRPAICSREFMDRLSTLNAGYVVLQRHYKVEEPA